MANPKHLEIVKRGAVAILEWRRKKTTGRLDLTGASLVEADLSAANLSMCNLGGANLKRAVFMETNLSGANLERANLANADLTAADLGFVDLDGANLTDAYLNWTNLSEASVSHANFTRARCFRTVFGDLDLSDVQGLEKIVHVGPSMIGVDTLFKSKGQIPGVFLRGCGVPENLIAYLSSLTGHALDFYSCFISYAEPDDQFSERLYNDLQAQGIRCWRWREDAKWGRSLMGEVDTAIRNYDKLIVICSENSLTSEPVIREIERALQKERKGKEVLFPIQVDDYVLKQWEHELRADVIRKNVGDFRKWKDPCAYDKSLTRLIKDLRSEPMPPSKP